MRPCERHVFQIDVVYLHKKGGPLLRESGAGDIHQTQKNKESTTEHCDGYLIGLNLLQAKTQTGRRVSIKIMQYIAEFLIIRPLLFQ
jgi:hypothetical protein